MGEFAPITTLAELDALDDAEVCEGYRDGRAGEPEPGNNRSRSYWHGWRCGQMDAGTLPIPPEHRALTAAYLARLRKDPPHA
jgi:hypothetical protein